jgi:protein SDA1
MQKLVEREKRLQRDPREAARRKRAVARGENVTALSDDDDSSDDGGVDVERRVQISGAVTPEDIAALAARKRQSKAEKLQKIIAGRTAFESKSRAGGSTNVEKKRKKNFQMSKFSAEARTKGRDKGSVTKRNEGSQGKRKQLKHDKKKRRRK